MTDSLDTLSDQALGELFAVEVADYKLIEGDGLLPRRFARPSGAWTTRPKFCTDANAVLPYLKEWRAYDWVSDAEERKRLVGNVCVSLVNGPCAYAPTFARAAVIALLLQARFEVELRGARASKEQP